MPDGSEHTLPGPVYRHSAAAVTRLVHSAPGGLSDSEATERLARLGPNTLLGRRPTPWFRRLAHQFRDPLVYLLLGAIAISLGAWAAEGAHGIPVDATVIAAVLALNALIGFAQELKAADAVAALARLTQTQVRVLRDGKLREIPASDVVVGDVLALAEGDAVGADARVLTATGLKVQEAALTGESAAIAKDPAPLRVTAGLGDQVNMVFRGTAVVEGVGRAVVVATGMDTQMGQIAQLLDATVKEPSPLERELIRVSKLLGILVVLIALLVMASLYLVSDLSAPSSIVNILLIGVSLAVAAVPEGLVAILSLVLAIGVRAMAQRRAVLKDLHSVETLGSASIICTDKTGTLTCGEMTLRELVTASGRLALTGSGYDIAGSAVACSSDSLGGRQAGKGRAGRDPTEGACAVNEEATELLTGGMLANNAALTVAPGKWQVVGDPTEAAFHIAAHKLDGVAERAAQFVRVGELPFTSERKSMSVCVRQRSAQWHRVYAKGAPDVLLGRCVAERVGGGVRPLSAQARQWWEDEVERLNEKGYRTLLVAYKEVASAHTQLGPQDETGLTLLGVACLIDPPRQEVTAAIDQARRAGIRPVMITGDHPVTARRIAEDLGIARPGAAVLTAVDLDAMTEEEFSRAVGETSVFARVAPVHKLRIITALQGNGETVAMTGDGVNDAPALKSAEIGVAMGVTGTEVSKDAADMILGDDNYATIVAAVRQGRVIYANIAKFLRYLLSSNLGEVVTVFVGVVAAGVFGLTTSAGTVIVPLLATQILWINLVTDSAPALAMGVDPEIDDVMNAPPRPKTARILDAATWVNVIWVGILMGLLTLLTIDIFLPGGLVEGSQSASVARTAGFTTLVFAQLMNAFCARSLQRTIFQGLFANPWLWAATCFGVAAQVAVVHLPMLQGAFGTTALSATQWLICFAMAAVVIVAQEAVKAAARRRGR